MSKLSLRDKTSKEVLCPGANLEKLFFSFFSSFKKRKREISKWQLNLLKNKLPVILFSRLEDADTDSRAPLAVESITRLNELVYLFGPPVAPLS